MRSAPAFSAEYKAHIASPEWAAFRRIALERAGYRCALCGIHIPQGTRVQGRHLELHHKHYETLQHERPEDVTVLCAGPGGCHSFADARRRATNGSSPARRSKRRGRKRRLPKPLRDLRNAALGLGSVIVLLKLAAVTLPT